MTIRRTTGGLRLTVAVANQERPGQLVFLMVVTWVLTCSVSLSEEDDSPIPLTLQQLLSAPVFGGETNDVSTGEDQVPLAFVTTRECSGNDGWVFSRGISRRVNVSVGRM